MGFQSTVSDYCQCVGILLGLEEDPRSIQWGFGLFRVQFYQSMTSSFDECLSAPGSHTSQTISSRYFKRKPEYALYKQVAEQRQKRVNKDTRHAREFAGYYSPSKHLLLSKTEVTHAIDSTKVTGRLNTQQLKDENCRLNNNEAGERSRPDPRASYRILNPESGRDPKLKTSNKENSKERGSSRESRTSLKQHEISQQNLLLKREIQKLKQENTLLHSQIKDNHSELQKLIMEHKQNIEMKKKIQIFQSEAKKKEDVIEYLGEEVARLAQQIEERGKAGSNKAEGENTLEEINAQHVSMIRKLTESTKNLQIQLYILKNREHQFVIDNAKLKNMQALSQKNKELKVSNLELRSKLDKLTRESELYEYSPEVTER